MSTVSFVIHAFGFVPMPPLLRPEVANNAASELDQLRAAITEVLGELHQNSHRLVVIGPREATPLGEWMVDQTGLEFEVQSLSLPADPDKDQVGAGATALTELTRDTDYCVLALGDGSASRSIKAPGYLDDRAVPFDDGVAGALQAANLDELIDLDLELASEILAAGRAVWPVCARVAKEQSEDWNGHLTFSDDPYGVSYFVALWRVGSDGMPKSTD